MASVATEINRFMSCSKRLQIILDDTKRCFDDINESGKSEAGQLFSAELLQEEEQEILATARKPPGIVIFGQNSHCKSCVVNEIFNRNIFPRFDNGDINGNNRMVQFKYGSNLSVGLSLPDGYDLAENLEAYKRPWSTIPIQDIEISENSNLDGANGTAVLEVSLNHSMLRQGAKVIVSPSMNDFGNDLEQKYSKCCEKISPILLYAFQTLELTESDLNFLKKLQTVSHYQPVCFVGINTRTSDSSDERTTDENVSQQRLQSETNFNGVVDTLDDNENHNLLTSIDEPEYHVSPMSSPLSRSQSKKVCRAVILSSSTVFQQLCDIGYLSESPGARNLSSTMTTDYYEVDSELIDNFSSFSSRIVYFVQQTIQRYLVNAATVLNNCHERCLNMFIVSAFDMARDMMITPKKLEFAREKETELYKSLMKISVEKGDEIKTMISETIQGIHQELVDKAAQYEFLGVDFDEQGVILTTKGLKICTYQIQELVLGALNQAIAGNLVRSVDVLRDTYTGTLSRCLESLERFDADHSPSTSSKSTSEALKQILNAAYQVEISLQSSSSFLRVILERMKQLVKAMPWSTPPRIDLEWKKKAAADILANLSEARLAKSISSQIKERLNKSHDAFAIALRQLEQKHSGRLDKIEDERLKLRKVHAPRVAKVALESTSLKDVILHGTPQMSREIGRGQYGVVYSCDSWSGFSPCAIKSVVPPDDKHWNDLALEFYYTKNIPPHERIVVLRGSVIDYMYGGGTSPAVLLIMDRLQRDLYAAIKQGLDWVSRLQVSIDVVEGIRFLHSQGLVHRDIKLKNVLLDNENRGKITDLGFCKPEAMMSGSIVGTPIHMAPELFSGRYDNSVDVYAFGILFWYVCAGHVKLPSAFEKCDNKDHLWTSVKKGLRPEKLATFDADCWNLMVECWEGEPLKRPLLGNVETRLQKIHEHFCKIQPRSDSPLAKKGDNRSRRISGTRSRLQSNQ
ncbi:dual serine/threonine and tyrosine protein kinase-like [Ylistrum balloti]|uniref:dual serine/threonine and tyrosine protein kinase-like n=1 Tax=Ylistrum balloti TaxID=509963 RepID=UPI002905C45D|nr:dual serine/threonine and tyrosine protein kinase-like [Ylistrum balloti]